METYNNVPVKLLHSKHNTTWSFNSRFHDAHAPTTICATPNSEAAAAAVTAATQFPQAASFHTWQVHLACRQRLPVQADGQQVHIVVVQPPVNHWGELHLDLCRQWDIACNSSKPQPAYRAATPAGTHHQRNCH
jgi:hypothetical protein